MLDAIVKLRKRVHHARQSVAHWMQMAKIETGEDDHDGMTLDRFVSVNVQEGNKMSSTQQLLLFCLNEFEAKQWQRSGDEVCEMVFARNGKWARTWRRVMPIHRAIWGLMDKFTNFYIWQLATSRANQVDDVANLLQSANDRQLPEIETDRHVFSFAGEALPRLYDASSDRFFPLGTQGEADLKDACKHFDCDFPLTTDPNGGKVQEDPRNIPTPTIDYILDYQDIPRDAKEWVFAFLGRLLHWIRERDNWQVVPFFYGVAGTGKSTILTTIAKGFYSLHQVGVLSSNFQRTFGLQDLASDDTLVFLAPEVKEDFNLPQSEFQNMASGDMVNVNIKNRGSKQIQWSIHGAFAGNVMPPYQDTSGCISRRMAVIYFSNIVRPGHTDGRLDEKLINEVPLALVKCNKFYLEKAHEFGGNDVWDHLPEFFTMSKRCALKGCNSMEHFLQTSEDIAFPDEPIDESMDLEEEGWWVHEHDLRALYNQHCRLNGFCPKKWTEESYKKPLQDRRVSGPTKRKTPNGDGKEHRVFLNIGISKQKQQTG